MTPIHHPLFSALSLIRDETVAKYVAALRALAEHCFYVDVLDEMLRD